MDYGCPIPGSPSSGLYPCPSSSSIVTFSQIFTRAASRCLCVHFRGFCRSNVRSLDDDADIEALWDILLNAVFAQGDVKDEKLMPWISGINRTSAKSSQTLQIIYPRTPADIFWSIRYTLQLHTLFFAHIDYKTASDGILVQLFGLLNGALV